MSRLSPRAVPAQRSPEPPASAARDLRHAARPPLSPHRLLRPLQGRELRQPGRTAGPCERAGRQRRLPMPAVRTPRPYRLTPPFRGEKRHFEQASSCRGPADYDPQPFVGPFPLLTTTGDYLIGDLAALGHCLLATCPGGRERLIDPRDATGITCTGAACARFGCAARDAAPDRGGGRAAVVSPQGFQCRARHDGAGCS